MGKLLFGDYFWIILDNKVSNRIFCDKFGKSYDLINGLRGIKYVFIFIVFLIRKG